MKRILIGCPSYNAHAHSQVNERLNQASKLHKVRVYPESGSILPEVFNKLWCAALNGYRRSLIDYFVMLHADVVPEPGWVDKLVELQQAHDADILSVVLPVKDNTGRTSTALGGDDPWDIRRILTLKECHSLPKVFSAIDCRHLVTAPSQLLVNTGCFIADLSKSWTTKHHFTLESDIVDDGKEFRVRASRSEDWNMSRFVNSAGGRVFATTAIFCLHYGGVYFGNDNWGN